MGVRCVITVAGVDADLHARTGLQRLADLEAMWSRFLPDSDISRLNMAGGSPVWVSSETRHLLDHMRAGVVMTNGDFNPTLLPLQMAADDAASLVDGGRTVIPSDAVPFSHLDQVKLFDDGRVSLPRGMTLDAGGIGKGLAADLIADELMAAGAHSVCVNVGGDLRVTGPTPDGNGWAVDILEPLDSSTQVARVNIASGAIATSSSRARWREGKGPERHHFSDLHASSVEAVRGVSVIASTAAWAEVWTKSAFIRPVDEYLEAVGNIGLAACVVTLDGAQRVTENWKAYEA